MAKTLFNRIFKKNAKKSVSNQNITYLPNTKIVLRKSHCDLLKFLYWKGKEVQGMVMDIFPSIPTMAAEINLTERTIYRLLGDFKESGILRGTGLHKIHKTVIYNSPISLVEQLLVPLKNHMAACGEANVTPDIVSLTPDIVSQNNAFTPDMVSGNIHSDFKKQINKLNTEPETIAETKDIYLFSCENNIEETIQEPSCQANNEMSTSEKILSEVKKLRANGEIHPLIANSKSDEVLAMEAGAHIAEQTLKINSKTGLQFTYSQGWNSFRHLVKIGSFATPNSMAAFVQQKIDRDQQKQVQVEKEKEARFRVFHEEIYSGLHKALINSGTGFFNESGEVIDINATALKAAKRATSYIEHEAKGHVDLKTVVELGVKYALKNPHVGQLFTF